MASVRRVVQYDRKGNQIEIYPSIKAASIMTGVGVPAISRCCNGLRYVGGGYIWAFEGEQPQYDHVRPWIVEYDLLGHEIARYETVKHAMEANPDANHAGIRDCLNGHKSLYRNHLWVYEDESQPLKKMKEYGRQIVSYTLDKQTRQEYGSIQEVFEKENIARPLINRALNENAICHDCVWFRYFDEERIQTFLDEKNHYALFDRLVPIRIVHKDQPIQEFRSVSEAAHTLGAYPHSIWLLANGYPSKYSVNYKVVIPVE